MLQVDNREDKINKKVFKYLDDAEIKYEINHKTKEIDFIYETISFSHSDFTNGKQFKHLGVYPLLYLYLNILLHFLHTYSL